MRKISSIKVDGKPVRLGLAYMYGNIDILMIDSRMTGVAIWGSPPVDELRESIIGGIQEIYGMNVGIEVLIEDT